MWGAVAFLGYHGGYVDGMGLDPFDGSGWEKGQEEDGQGEDYRFH